ncbi:hypothetical protein A3B36_00275 [Candidatus Uhrbacteria bacterium RIFCSPLOWO2_01_FULL_55_36]|uniref:DUF4134 domain-containing protein n=1 Tax=Candidatus Uhrbacteria bacterium RIFCSPLOWO2_01_FULL_55_36 TaxID=1802404 RepID=A0A1F7V166_9BACT|nr:MAG: hypothetical protein A3B36_00275 [Candidatus Uhrbacteria bacterium RIFCSPLOWO2_01_FULL_55_36]
MITKRLSYCVALLGYSLVPLLARAAKATCDSETDLCPPVSRGGSLNVLEILGAGLQVILGMIGVVAFIMIIVGAARWMTAGGSAEGVDKGKGMIAWAFMGLVLAAAAFAVTDFVFGGLRNAFFGGKQ